MTLTTKQRGMVIFVTLSLLFVGIIVFVGLKLKSRLKQKALVETTSYEQAIYKPEWPLQPSDNQQNSFYLRMVLEPEIHLGKIPYQDLMILAWNYGIYTDRNNNLQRIAIPRAWQNPTQQKVFFLSAVSPNDVPTFTEKYIVAVIEAIDKNISNKQRLVGIFYSPADPNMDPNLLSFYKELSTLTLPESFLNTGSTADLPSAPLIGKFFPASQLMFDVTQ